jgi:Fe2+ or Zn2+ uptake regulation protein
MIINNVGDYLKNHGIKPSYQRIKIFEYLIKYKNHPTVDTIYRELVNKIPTLSRTTVYNTLKLFVEQNVAIIINIEDNELRYDADVSKHGHFKCDKCGKIYDFNVNFDNINLEEIKKFKIHEYHFYLKGICNNCANIYTQDI